MCIFNIGIAEHKIAKSPDRITTLGLGSCVGVVLYDAISTIGGMVHIMLPSAPCGCAHVNKSKFADTAITELICRMTHAGARQSNLTAKLAGGAYMFNDIYDSGINVGLKNIAMCREILRENAIPVVGEDVGGTSGRSIDFCCASSLLQVRTISPKSVRYI